ncbi:hypothetical protein MBT84_22190 [Streptomyces sp. MBT84]|nr:hypothetical protein [Streptomyces sp. MBT84]
MTSIADINRSEQPRTVARSQSFDEPAGPSVHGVRDGTAPAYGSEGCRFESCRVHTDQKPRSDPGPLVFRGRAAVKYGNRVGRYRPWPRTACRSRRAPSVRPGQVTSTGDRARRESSAERRAPPSRMRQRERTERPVHGPREGRLLPCRGRARRGSSAGFIAVGSPGPVKPGPRSPSAGLRNGSRRRLRLLGPDPGTGRSRPAAGSAGTRAGAAVRRVCRGQLLVSPSGPATVGPLPVGLDQRPGEAVLPARAVLPSPSRITPVTPVTTSPVPPGLAVLARRPGGTGRARRAGGAGRTGRDGVDMVSLEVDAPCPQIVDLHLVGDDRSCLRDERDDQ